MFNAIFKIFSICFHFRLEDVFSFSFVSSIWLSASTLEHPRKPHAADTSAPRNPRSPHPQLSHPLLSHIRLRDWLANKQTEQFCKFGRVKLASLFPVSFVVLEAACAKQTALKRGSTCQSGNPAADCQLGVDDNDNDDDDDNSQHDDDGVFVLISTSLALKNCLNKPVTTKQT